MQVPAAFDDAALVRRCRRGDPAATRELIDRHHAEVFSLCIRMLGHRQDAEDVSQEVFLRVFRSLHRWDPTRPLRPWIMGITVNRCRTWLTQRAKRPELHDYLQETAECRPADDADELIREVAAAIDELRPLYRAAFVMFHEQGMPYDDIAAALERPLGTIKTWLHRARVEVLQRLRERGMVTDDEPHAPTPNRER